MEPATAEFQRWQIKTKNAPAVKWFQAFVGRKRLRRRGRRADAGIHAPKKLEKFVNGDSRGGANRLKRSAYGILAGWPG
jgi:hypothetical protein